MGFGQKFRINMNCGSWDGLDFELRRNLVLAPKTNKPVRVDKLYVRKQHKKLMGEHSLCRVLPNGRPQRGD